MNLKKIFDSIELYEKAAEKAKSLGQNKRAERFSSYASQLTNEVKDNVPQLLKDYFMERLPKALDFINNALSKNGLATFSISDFDDTCEATVGDIVIYPDPACVRNVLHGGMGEIDTCVEDDILSKDYKTANYIDLALTIHVTEDLTIYAGFDMNTFANIWFDFSDRTESPKIARFCASLCNDLGLSDITKNDFIA